MDGFSDIYYHNIQKVEEKPCKNDQNQEWEMPWWIIVLLTVFAIIFIIGLILYPYINQILVAYSIVQSVKSIIPNF